MQFPRFRPRRLSGKKVAILAADGFEYIELSVPKQALRAAGASVDIISLHAGRIRGMNLTEPARSVPVTRTLDEVHPDTYDALMIPGGFIGPDFLRQSASARGFVRAMDAANKPIATLCHGPWLLVSAELVRGRKLAAWPGIRDDIVHAGGIWRDEPVVRDGNWVTSRSPQDLLTFVPAMLDLIATSPVERVSVASADVASQDGKSSPQADAPPHIALAGARLLTGRSLSSFPTAVAATAMGALGYAKYSAPN